MLSHQAMADALIQGAAALLSHTITTYARHQDSWWGRAPFGWVHLTDPEACAALDSCAQKLAAADAAAHLHPHRAHPAQLAGGAR